MTAPETGDATKRERAVALFLSPDFYLGVPAGFLFGLIPALLPAVRENGFAFYSALGGVSATLTGLVLAAMSILLSGVGKSLMRLLQQAPGGLAGVFVPFVQVAVISAVGAVLSLVVAAIAPLYKVTEAWGIWLWASVPVALFLWALVGVLQLTGLVINLLSTSRQADELEERRTAALDVARQQREGAQRHAPAEQRDEQA